MAKIYLNIEAESADDLRDTLARLNAGAGYNFPAAAAAAAVALRDAFETPALNAGINDAPEETVAEKAKRTRGPNKPKDTAPADPFAEQVAEVVAEAKAEKTAEGPTIEQVRKAMTEKMASSSAKEVQDILEKATGAKKLSDLDPADYAKALAAFSNG